MKFQVICFTLITFCITNSLSAACDDNSITSSPHCKANKTCEWKEKTTGTCGETTKNTAGEDCVGKVTRSTCDGKCVFTPTASNTPNDGTCAAGTKLSDGTSACSTATTSTACNGGCTWTPDYECAVKTASPGSDNTSPTGNDTTNSTNTTGNNTTNPTNNAFRLKISSLISLGLITLF